jgi:hypothetical protein
MANLLIVDALRADTPTVSNEVSVCIFRTVISIIPEDELSTPMSPMVQAEAILGRVNTAGYETLKAGKWVTHSVEFSAWIYV